LVGFQVEGTLGRQLLDGTKYIKVHGESLPVRANVTVANCFSAHADQLQLINWLSQIKGIKKLYLNHGEKENIEALSAIIKERFNFPVEIPAKIPTTTTLVR
jgi:metallo-beta-lactamase family protein